MSKFDDETTTAIQRVNTKYLRENDVKILINKELTKRDSRLETKQTLWVKLGLFLIPLIILFFVFISELKTDVFLLKNQMEINTELRDEIRSISNRLHNIELILARKGLDE